MAGEMTCIRLCSMSMRNLTPPHGESSLISLESFLLPKLGNLGLILAERFPEIGKVYFWITSKIENTKVHEHSGKHTIWRGSTYLAFSFPPSGTCRTHLPKPHPFSSSPSSTRPSHPPLSPRQPPSWQLEQIVDSQRPLRRHPSRIVHVIRKNLTE